MSAATADPPAFPIPQLPVTAEGGCILLTIGAEAAIKNSFIRAPARFDA